MTGSFKWKRRFRPCLASRWTRIVYDVTQPPVEVEGTPSTKELFEKYQAIGQLQKHAALGSLQALHSLTTNTRRPCAIQFRAFKLDDSALCAYMLAKAFDELEKHFGVTKEDHVAVKMPESDRIAREIKKLPQLASGYLLEGFLTSMRLEAEKKEKANKIAFTVSGNTFGKPTARFITRPKASRKKRRPVPQPNPKSSSHRIHVFSGLE
jgi:hypothetical protein